MDRGRARTGSGGGRRRVLRPGAAGVWLALGALAALAGAGCGEGGPGPTGDADTAGDAAACGPCGAAEHCDPGGACVPDLCIKGETTCASPVDRQVCDEDGGGYEVVPCPAGLVCDLGRCLPVVCSPDAAPSCDGPSVRRCSSVGTGYVTTPCAPGTACDGGACVPLEANVLLLVDTSGSMNTVVDRGVMPDACEGDGCPPWAWPGTCDDPDAPVTRLGRVKDLLQRLVATEAASGVRLALQRFPQREADKGQAGCVSGWYVPVATVSGDDGGHLTAPDGWLVEHLGEIVPVPHAPEGGTDVAALEAWVDFHEALGATDAPCENDWDCPSFMCAQGTCRRHEDPELRAVGGTPLGRSLFYAGEYLRHRVLVEGRPCAADADCGSPHHTCVAGACHDPLRACRPTAIVILTDGLESQHVDPGDFLHPRVQAKRLHYGLGCDGATPCLAGASCVHGICRPPPGAVDEETPVCAVGDTPCEGPCEDPCATGTCPNPCLPGRVDVSEGQGADHLVNAAGEPLSIDVHVVDASGVPGRNRLVATYGGGMLVPVDLGDPEALLAEVVKVVGTVKEAARCASP